MHKKHLLTSHPEEIATDLQGDALHMKPSVGYMSQEFGNLCHNWERRLAQGQ